MAEGIEYDTDSSLVTFGQAQIYYDEFYRATSDLAGIDIEYTNTGFDYFELEVTHNGSQEDYTFGPYEVVEQYQIQDIFLNDQL